MAPVQSSSPFVLTPLFAGHLLLFSLVASEMLRLVLLHIAYGEDEEGDDE